MAGNFFPNVIALRKCEIEVDPDGLPIDAMTASAFVPIQAFADALERSLLRSGVKYRRVCVRPVASEALLKALAEPDAFRLEVTYEPVEVGETE